MDADDAGASNVSAVGESITFDAELGSLAATVLAVRGTGATGLLDAVATALGVTGACEAS